MRYIWNCLLVGLFATPVYCDEPLNSKRADPAVDYVIVLSVEVGSSGVARFDGKTYSEVSPLSHALVERMTSDHRSAKTGGGKPIFNVTLLAHSDAKIGRVMLIQQALSKLPYCNMISLQPAAQDVAASDNTARDGLSGQWQPVFSQRDRLYQVIDLKESFTFKDDQLVLTNRSGTTKYDVTVAAGSPASIDVRTKEGRTTRGILARHGDIAVICWDQSFSSQRPQEFEASTNPDHVLMVLLRDKSP